VNVDRDPRRTRYQFAEENVALYREIGARWLPGEAHGALESLPVARKNLNLAKNAAPRAWICRMSWQARSTL
jgi:hypothetical protein